MPSTFVFLHNYSEADCFQATPTPLIFTQCVCTNFRYQPFLLNMISPFPFPHNAGTDVLDNLQKLHQ